MSYLLTVLRALVLVTLGCAPALAAAGVPTPGRVQTSLDRDLVQLGRPFFYRMSLTHAQGERVAWPAAEEFGPAFAEVSRRSGERAASAGLVTSELTLELMLFDTAVTEVPGLAVSVAGSSAPLRSSALPVRVQGLVDLDDPRLRPQAPPVEVLVRDTRFLALLGAAPVGLLLLAIAYLVWRRREANPARATRRTQPRLPPDEEALRRLASLETSGLLEQSDLKPAYLRMSEIVRDYMGQRFGFSSLDLTTSEIQSRLQAADDGKEEWIASVMSWLTRCDLVKYARSAADREDASEALGLARAWIEQTRVQEANEPELANA